MPDVFPDWEKVLREVILPDLDKGRPDFDRPHTEAVVYWIKQICDAELELDKKVLVTAAYAHDWGYIGLFDDGVTDMRDIHTKKEKHMEVGAERIEALLQERFGSTTMRSSRRPAIGGTPQDDVNLFSKVEIERVRHLVFMHDRVEELQDDDEIALMEADTLGALDADRVKPTFTQADNDRYIQQEIRNRRWLRFRHAKAREVFEEVLQRRLRFYEENVLH